MNPALRGSAAHVFVTSLAVPQLNDADDHHLRKVLRIRETDILTASDGCGSWVTARLTASGLTVASSATLEPGPPRTAVMTAIPKGDRPEWIVQKLTEIGASTITFLDCARSVVRWDDARAGKQLERLRRVAREAAMQSRRVWLPEVCEVVPFGHAAAMSGCAIADPDGDGLDSTTDTILVGPEGGFTDGERDLVARRVRLSANVLCVETAALAAGFLLTQRARST
ncbi:MAG TPA: RsmE family RNA methyltransferase [Ilumatobacteraceae bacterium]|nr:RsmE family RNA methyltransferase [Ilumatobacteraceae bacterium]